MPTSFSCGLSRACYFNDEVREILRVSISALTWGKSWGFLFQCWGFLISKEKASIWICCGVWRHPVMTTTTTTLSNELVPLITQNFDLCFVMIQHIYIYINFQIFIDFSSLFLDVHRFFLFNSKSSILLFQFFLYHIIKLFSSYFSRSISLLLCW